MKPVLLRAVFLALAALFLPIVTAQKPCSALPLRGETLFQFNAPNQWIENVVERQNGDLLFTLAGPRAQVYLMKNPRGTTNPSVTLLHDFSAQIPGPNTTAQAGGPSVLVGIAEPRPDIFVTAGGLLTRQRASVPGSWAVFELAFQGQTDNVATRMISTLPGAEFPNGIVPVDDWASGETSAANYTSAVLIGDATRGQVYRVDTTTGNVSTVVHGLPEMQPQSNGKPPFGINGMKMRSGGRNGANTLWFDNSNERNFYTVAVRADGSGLVPNAQVDRVGSAERVAPFVDDFDVESDGTIWAAGSFGNTLLVMDNTTGEAVVAAGSNTSLSVGGPTAVTLGRKAGDGVLYVVTSGAQGQPINGTVQEPGKVLRFNISGYAACKGGGRSGGGDGGPQPAGGDQGPDIEIEEGPK
ncbi:hypothetical protein P8C59_000871 [Phyllachora maydis]|uniref:SMP-30/Gluconolactonase/LRE-like region domain-containing protein n=1 Tax=Phyllachora maydis TaxID=1825666 RepID=A0AAD9M744_9PEZI|nr:hypothetical protein P8C59_000871 [Phyllachora maydis]